MEDINHLVVIQNEGFSLKNMPILNLLGKD